MSQAQNALRQYAFIAESTFGVTPGTPQTQLFDPVSFDGDPQSEQLNSNTIRADRQLGFSRRGNQSAAGSMEVELCHAKYDSFLEAFTGGTWAANELLVGNTARSFAIEEGFTDLVQYRVFNGLMFDTFSVSITPEALVTGTFGFMGSGVSALTGTSIDATPTAITPKATYFHEGGTISEGGSTVAYVTGLQFEVKNNLAGSYALGSTSYRSIALGKVEVTGTVTALFESATLANKYANNTASSITATIGDGTNTMTFGFPDVRYTGLKMQRAASGPVLVELTFTGVYSTNTSFKISRSS